MGSGMTGRFSSQYQLKLINIVNLEYNSFRTHLSNETNFSIDS